MAVQVLGKVAYFNKGVYNSQTNYEINDVVSYNGSSYVSLNDNNQGNLPTNTNYWSVVAEKGDKGDTGKPFVIEKTYSTIESMVADYDNMNVNDYVMIQGSIEEQENATLWTKREVEVSPYKWAYLADFSGASGITGATPNIHIGNVTEGNEPSVTRRSGSSNENPILDFVLKTGAKGDTGATGNGISSIEKTSTSGLVDTYTITFTNGTSTTIEVTNGRGIVSIAKTSSVDYVDTYTITYNDGTTSTFEVANSEVTEEEFDDVVDELNYLYDDLPKVEGEGTNLTLDNTRKGKMSTMLKGNLSQKTNIITYTCLGTETGDYYFVYNSINYQFTMPTISANDVLVFNTDTLKLYLDTTEISTTTASTGTLITMNATPNPDYPQDVHVVSGNNDIQIYGKNLFDANNPMYVNMPLQADGVVSGSSATSNVSQYIQVRENTNYTLSLTNDNNSRRISFYSKELTSEVTTEDVISTISYGGNTKTFETPTGCKYIRFSYYNTSTDVQLEQKSTATTYQPYESQTYPINLGAMELCKIGDYQDYIYKDNGKWYKHSEIGKVVFDGTENWYENVNNIQATLSSITFISNSECFSNYFKSVLYSSSEFGISVYQSGNTPYVRVNQGKTKIGGLSTFKAWLSSHNTTLYYPLATSTNTEITDQTLIAQLDNFEKAISYNNQTNISQENNDLPFIISASAFMSLKYLFGNLETRVAELEG